MLAEAEIERIIKAVGPHQPKDYKLRPDDHGDAFTTLPDLQKRLSNSAIKALAEEYENYSSKAVTAQRKFKKFTRFSRALTFLTGAFAAALVMLHTLYGSSTDAWVGYLLVTLGVLAGASGILASTFLMLVKGLKLLSTWMQSRATAEMTRIEYFEAVCALPAEANVTMALSQLEYFRRFHLEMQKDFYANRTETLTKKSGFSVTLIALLTAFAGVATLIVANLDGDTSVGHRLIPVIVAISLVAQAFAAMIANREETEQNQRTAERYDRSRSALNKLSGQLSAVRNGIAAGKVDLLPSFLAATNEPLKQEHSQWLDDMDKHNAALSSLEKDLKKLDSGA